MFRCVLTLVLALQLLVPPRALPWSLLLHTPPPPSTEGEPAEAKPEAKSAPLPKPCPCTGAASCCCGDCCSDPSEKNPENGSTNPPTPPKAPAKTSADTISARSSSSAIAQMRCRCKTTESLDPETQYFAKVCPLTFAYFEPPQIDVLSNLSDTLSSLSFALDPPPPRNLV